MTNVLHEEPQQTAFLLGEQSPNDVIICFRDSCFPVNVYLLRRVLLKYGTVGPVLAQDIKHQMKCVCN